MMLRPIALVLALAAPGLAWGEAYDAPERLARLTYVEGEVTFKAAREPATSTLPDRPLLEGDSLTTDADARAELALGAATLRLDEQSEITVLDLEPRKVRIELTSGSANVYLRELLEDETFEIVTLNAEIELIRAGEYRVDAQSERVTALSVRAGVAEVATAGGPVRVADGQRVRIEGRDAIARLETPRPADAFDDWVLDREVRLAEAEPTRYTPYEGGGYEELDRYGEWHDEPRYGRVWLPSYYGPGWSPYRSGYWERYDYGWSWIDPAPWGFYTLHYGRWAYFRDRDRWYWVPGPTYPYYNPPHPHPYGHPRNRPRETPESAPRTAYGVPDARDGPAPVVAPRVPAPRIDPTPRVPTPRINPTPVRDGAADDRSRGTTHPRGGNRTPRPAPPAAPPPGNDGPTMRPSRESSAPVSAPPTMSPRMKGDVGRRDMN